MRWLGNAVRSATGGRRDWRGAYTRIASGARRARQSPSRHERRAYTRRRAGTGSRCRSRTLPYRDGRSRAVVGDSPQEKARPAAEAVTGARPWGREAQGGKPEAQRKARGRTAGIGGVGGRRFYAMKPPAGLQGSGVAVASRRIKLSSVKAESAESRSSVTERSGVPSQGHDPPTPKATAGAAGSVAGSGMALAPAVRPPQHNGERSGHDL
jgi:hypothetical protein